MFYLEEHSGIVLQYLAEGAANVIYKPIPPPGPPNFQPQYHRPGTTSPTELPSLTRAPTLEGKLIRLRKDISTTLPVTVSYAHFENIIQPLFQESELVKQSLFRISPILIQNLNLELRGMERTGQRPAKRRGNYLATDEDYGTLITDMSGDEGHMSVEFKPKWLVQSPSAPANSKRCRTCALRAMRHFEGKGNLESFCPLKLVSGNVFDLDDTSRAVMASRRSMLQSVGELMQLRVHNWLTNSPLISRLAELQAHLDPVGVLEADVTSEDFLAAMTLRDCTLFLRVPLASEVTASEIEGRLGDLDLKSAGDVKARYWRSTERRLIDEGWYTQNEDEKGQKENHCSLQHGT